jgi:uncharacterized LabA/DUF88 family protein
VSKNVAVFVDVANIFYAAKAAGVDIDYVTLLKSATAGRDFVRAYAYTGLDPDNENQRNFHNFLARNGYKVVSKDIRKYGDGKVKANLDIELVVDLMKTARNLDVAVVVSGDGDFAPAIRAVQEMGVRVEVVSFRGNTSSDLIEVADLFTDITHVARVEKGSSRSGRRVAGDDEDLSMTEVPDKQTEGSGRGRGGRGRTGRAREAEPVAATSGRRRTSVSARPAPPTPALAAAPTAIVALPGEKLSKAAVVAPEEREQLADEDAAAAGAVAADAVAMDVPVGDGVGESEEGRRRRRRRRGGRGRGRGRGPETTGVAEEGSEELEGLAGIEELEELEEVTDAAAYAPAARAPRPGAFGSVWDRQIGVPSSAGRVEPAAVEEDFDEPEIPEYLIAEQRRGGRGSGRSGQTGRGQGRGGRSAYVAAVERERYGGGRSGGINRYPDVSGRGVGRVDPGRRPDRGDRPDRPPRRTSSEPWSEVPPELEEMLRAQLDARVARGAAVTDRAAESAGAEAAAAEAAAEEPSTEAGASAKPAARRRSTPKASASGAVGSASPTEAGAPAKPTTRRRTTKSSTTADGGPTETDAASASTSEAAAKPRRRTTSKVDQPAAGDGGAAATEPEAAAKPRRRTTRKAATPD